MYSDAAELIMDICNKHGIIFENEINLLGWRITLRKNDMVIRIRPPVDEKPYFLWIVFIFSEGPNGPPEQFLPDGSPERLLRDEYQHISEWMLIRDLPLILAGMSERKIDTVHQILQKIHRESKMLPIMDSSENKGRK